MTNDITEDFFRWLDDQGLKPKDVAEDLGNEWQTVSSWRSKGVPKGKRPACKALMEKSKRAALQDDTANKIAVEFSDDEMDLILEVSRTLGTPYREYINRSTVARARQDARLIEEEQSRGNAAS